MLVRIPIDNVSMKSYCTNNKGCYPAEPVVEDWKERKRFILGVSPAYL